VAVTGGSGQLGTLVLRLLLEDPAIERVISIDRRPPVIGSAKLEAIDGDVRDADLARHLRGVEALIHCAFIVTGHERSEEYRAVNVGGSENVFRAAAEAGVQTIVFVSSISAYGVVQGHPVPIVEATPRVRQADFAYAACKFDVEAFLDAFEPQHPQIAISRIRPNILIGLRMPHALGGMMRVGCLPDNDGVPLVIVWDEDVADLIIQAMKQRARGAFVAVADELLPTPELVQQTGGKSIKVSRMVISLYGALHALLVRFGVHRLPDPAWVTRTRVPLIGSSERARRELGWAPRYPTAVAVVDRFRAVAPRRPDLRLLLVLWMLGRATRSAGGNLAGRSGRIGLRLNGRVAGDFSLVVEGGKMRVRLGALSSPTSTVTMMGDLFRDLLAGRASFEEAMSSGQIDWFGADDRDLFRRIIALAAPRERSGWRGAAANLAARIR
jgi:nucleoside-diphosphate-sugar epimerase